MSLGLDPNYWYFDGEAYDLTDFIERHPGGKWALLLGKGHECETLFHSYHLDPYGKPMSVLKKYRVPDEKQPKNEKFKAAQKFTFAKDGFYTTLKDEVNRYFLENNLSHKADWTHWFMVIGTHLMMFLTMAGMCNAYFGLGMLCAMALVHGFFRAMLVVQTVHAASHYSLSTSPFLNRWFYRIGTVLIGLWAPPVWDIQHVIAHHVYTNEWPFDTDSAFPIKSIHANQRRFAYHGFQHLYMWLVYCFTIPLVLINSVRVVLTRKQMLFKLTFDVPGSLLEGWLCSALGIAYLVMPYFFLDFWTASLVCLINNVVSSLIFSLQFVVNHEVDEVVHMHPPEGVVYDWGEFECMTSANFAAHSTLSLELSGGLNTQIEHHLFPGVHYGHYKKLAEITQKVIKERFPHVPYHGKPTLLEALQSHYTLLKNPPRSTRPSKKQK